MTLINKALGYYQPVVRLTEAGRKQLSNGELRHGKLRGVNEKGQLRIRFFGCRHFTTFHPSFWEFAPEQIDERRGVR